MNKEEFLKELQNRICILAAAEQQDILGEYAQHIDLRTAAGLTEEEAIRDFGDLGQLAAEILEAYHVDPSRLRAPGPVRPPLLPRLSSGLKRTGTGLGGFFQRLAHGAAVLFRRCGRGIAGLFRRFRLGFQRLFHQIHRPERPEKPITKEVPSMEPQTPPALSGAGRTIRRAGRGLCRFLKALVHLAWNLLLALAALPFAAASMLALVCIGLLLVLLVQGYPLLGLLLCCLGGAMCCAAVLGLGATLVWRRPAPPAATPIPEPAGTELSLAEEQPVESEVLERA